MLRSYMTIIGRLKYQNVSTYIIELLIAMDELQIVSLYSTFSENYSIIKFSR
jgi:hypothetical protein